MCADNIVAIILVKALNIGKTMAATVPKAILAPATLQATLTLAQFFKR